MEQKSQLCLTAQDSLACESLRDLRVGLVGSNSQANGQTAPPVAEMHCIPTLCWRRGVVTRGASRFVLGR